MNPDISNRDVLQSIRMMAWRRAKGEIDSILDASYGRMKDPKRFSQLCKEFFAEVEDNGLLDDV